MNCDRQRTRSPQVNIFYILPLPMTQREPYGSITKMRKEYIKNVEHITRQWFAYRLKHWLLEKKPVGRWIQVHKIIYQVLKQLPLLKESWLPLSDVMSAVANSIATVEQMEFIKKKLPDTVTYDDLLKLGE